MDKQTSSGEEGKAARERVTLPALLKELSNLRRRTKELEAAVEAAQKRADFYEQYDAKLQGALSTALQVAFEIKMDAEDAAQAIVDEALQRKAALEAELETLQQQVERLQREGTERARVAHEVLAAREPYPEVAKLPSEAPELAREVVLAEPKPPAEPLPTPPVRESVGVPVAEEVTVALPVQPAPARVEPALVSLAPKSVGHNGTVELVISPLPSFLRLVDFERSLNNVPVIRNFYVRDFQRGVATIEVHLVAPERWEALIEGLRKITGLQVAAIEPSAKRIEARLEVGSP